MVEDILLLRLWSKHLVEYKSAIDLLVCNVLGNGDLSPLFIASDDHGSADPAFLLAQWPASEEDLDVDASGPGPLGGGGGGFGGGGFLLLGGLGSAAAAAAIEERGPIPIPMPWGGLVSGGAPGREGGGRRHGDVVDGCSASARGRGRRGGLHELVGGGKDGRGGRPADRANRRWEMGG